MFFKQLPYIYCKFYVIYIVFHFLSSILNCHEKCYINSSINGIKSRILKYTNKNY